MKNDIRYSEFLFLQALDTRDPRFAPISASIPTQPAILGLHQMAYRDMLITLAEDLYVEFEGTFLQLLVGRLRGEIAFDLRPGDSRWVNPRDTLKNLLISQTAHPMRITYRGLRRIEELRELLKRDRILEREGILLDMRYFYSDLQDALQRSSDTVVSVLRLDMDDFKAVNNLGHAAGDEVMRNYLQTVKDTLGSLGDSYRGVGDEVACVIVGQEEKRVFEIAEGIRGRIEQMECKYKGTALPRVTVSIGIATTPPAAREMGLDDLADSRQLLAKKNGKNRIVTTG